MVTSAEFDKVLVPVDYQKDVLFRTFDSLIGFNKKNKKGKFMKAIKEEWENGKWVAKTSDQKKAEAMHKAIQDKIDSGAMKVVSLDAKKEKKAPAKKKAEEKKLYTGNLLNKVGKTLGQIEKEAKENAATPRAIRVEVKEPGDTHYTVDEIVEYAWKRSPKIREKFQSDIIFKEQLLKSQKLRKLLDEKMIAKIGHKPEKKTRKAATPAEKKEKIELESDLYKIADWFWDKKNTNSFKILFPDVDSYAVLFRTIKNDDRGPKFFAKIMKNNGYRKEAEKPFVSKVTVVKKGQAACDFEKEGEAAVKNSDAVWDNVKSFFTSWAKENGLKLTPEAIESFKNNVYKTIVYYNTMSILKGDK